MKEPADAPPVIVSVLSKSTNLVCLSLACNTSNVTSLNKSADESEPVNGSVAPVYAMIYPFLLNNSMLNSNYSLYD